MPGINKLIKLKKLNFLNKNKSKIILVLTLVLTKQKNIRCLKTNSQACQIICLFVVCRDKFHYFKKSCSSNLLVAKIKSIVALIILELLLGLSDIFPKSKVYVKTLLVFSKKLWLKLPKVRRRVRLSLKNWGQWRRKCSADSTSFRQLHSGFNVSWKPCLNLCSLK